MSVPTAVPHPARPLRQRRHVLPGTGVHPAPQALQALSLTLLLTRLTTSVKCYLSLHSGDAHISSLKLMVKNSCHHSHLKLTMSRPSVSITFPEMGQPFVPPFPPGPTFQSGSRFLLTLEHTCGSNPNSAAGTSSCPTPLWFIPSLSLAVQHGPWRSHALDIG